MGRRYLSPPNLAPADRGAATDGWEWAKRVRSPATAWLTCLTIDPEVAWVAGEQSRLLETHDIESRCGVRAAFGAS